jgi:Xaa-Pro dipeptidase
MTNARRIEQLQHEVDAAELDAVAVIPGPNLIYLTGLPFHLSERPVVAIVPVEGPPGLILPVLEQGKGERAVGWQLFTYDDVSGPADAFRQALAAMGLAGRRLGIEGRRIRFLELDLMAHSGSAPVVVNADPVFAQLRMRKDAGEVDAMRRAAQIAQDALRSTLPTIRAGQTERTVAAELTLRTLRAGSDPELPFLPIVASGPNGANPHGFPTDRQLQPGDLVTLDWGAAYGGYFSDITRTYALAGAPVDPELLRAYTAVHAANAAGRRAVRPGATGQDIDRAARAAIDAAGFGPYFVHRTGHGLGLEGHEEPDAKEGNLLVLEPGMTFTVEPGVYLPGLGGIRIEDDLLVTADGGESLTDLPRDLETIGMDV